MSTLEDLTRDYRTGFLRYLPHRSESAMTAGYELGRRAARSGSSLLDLVQAHHRVLGEVLTEEPPPDTTGGHGGRLRVLQRGALDLRDGAPRRARPGREAVARALTSAGSVPRTCRTQELVPRHARGSRGSTEVRGNEPSTGRSWRCEALRRMHPEPPGVGGRDGSARAVQRVRPALRHAGPAHPGPRGDVPGARPDPRQLPARRDRRPSASRFRPRRGSTTLPARA